MLWRKKNRFTYWFMGNDTEWLLIDRAQTLIGHRRSLHYYYYYYSAVVSSLLGMQAWRFESLNLDRSSHESFIYKKIVARFLTHFSSGLPLAKLNHKSLAECLLSNVCCTTRKINHFLNGLIGVGICFPQHDLCHKKISAIKGTSRASHALKSNRKDFTHS